MQISDLLKPYALPAEWADAMLKRVNEERQHGAQVQAGYVAVKQAEIAQVSDRLSGRGHELGRCLRLRLPGAAGSDG